MPGTHTHSHTCTRTFTITHMYMYTVSHLHIPSHKHTHSHTYTVTNTHTGAQSYVHFFKMVSLLNSRCLQNSILNNPTTGPQQSIAYTT